MEPVLHATGELPVLLRKIFGIADDGMADMRHVRAQLVGAAGHGLEREPGHVPGRGIEHGVIGHSVARALFAMPRDAHERIILGLLLGKKRGDAPLPRLRYACDQRPIDLPRRTRAEGFGERRGGKARFCDQ